MDNREEMDEFLEKYNPPKLNQEETENLNRLNPSMEIRTVIKNLPTNKSPRPGSFTGELYKIFKEDYPSQTTQTKLNRRKTFQTRFTKPALLPYQNQRQQQYRKRRTPGLAKGKKS